MRLALRFRLMSVYQEKCCDRDVCLDLKVCQKMTCNTRVRKTVLGARDYRQEIIKVVVACGQGEKGVLLKLDRRLLGARSLSFVDTCLIYPHVHCLKIIVSQGICWHCILDCHGFNLKSPLAYLSSLRLFRNQYCICSAL